MPINRGLGKADPVKITFFVNEITYFVQNHNNANVIAFYEAFDLVLCGNNLKKKKKKLTKIDLKLSVRAQTNYSK